MPHGPRSFRRSDAILHDRDSVEDVANIVAERIELVNGAELPDARRRTQSSVLLVDDSAVAGQDHGEYAPPEPHEPVSVTGTFVHFRMVG